MSKYTTEVRYICEEASGFRESKGYNDVDLIIKEAIPKIFSFDFPIFDESYRDVLEKKILKHYYTREIGEETAGLWKLRLDTKLNEIMPYYNKLYESELLEFNPLYTTNLTREKNTKYDRDSKTKNKGVIDSDSKSSGSGSGNNSSTSVDLYSDTPQGSLTGVEQETYLTNARKINDNGSSSSKSSNKANSKIVTNEEGNDKVNSTEDYVEKVYGYEGRSASALLKEFRETFLNIDMMVIGELESLFLQLW